MATRRKSRSNNPSYSLQSIKSAAKAQQLIFKMTPLTNGEELGYSYEDILAVIQRLDKSAFKKTMPSTDFPGEMIDVYLIFDCGLDLYLELAQTRGKPFKLIAFHLE